MTDEHWRQYQFQVEQLIASGLSAEEIDEEVKKLRKHFSLPPL
jgi:hypothetical protein